MSSPPDEEGVRMTPDQHASRAERLLADALRRGRTSRRATVLATAALAHAELALYRSSRGSAGRWVGAAGQPGSGAQPGSWIGQPGDRVGHSRGGRLPGSPVPGSAVPGSPVPGSPVPGSPVSLGDTLFDRLKGSAGIAAVVSDFYRKVGGDIQLSHYFERTPMPFLQRHMVAFLIQATGGPREYRGRDLHEVHEPLRITGRDFDRVAEHLVGTLREHGIAEADIDAVARVLAPLRPVIVTQGTPAYPVDPRAAAAAAEARRLSP
jgi:hemoglobin